MMMILHLLVLMAIPVCHGWICGRYGECRCSKDGGVFCPDSAACPLFPEEWRQGKTLYLDVPSGTHLPLADQDNLQGFWKVLVNGLDAEGCAKLRLEAPNVICGPAAGGSGMSGLHQTLQTPTITTDTTTTKTTETDSTDSDEDTDNNRDGMMMGLLTWSVLSTLFFAAMVIIILVSLVSLNSRLNTYRHDNVPPSFAVSCCLNLTALVLCPVVLCAKCIGCKCCGLGPQEDFRI